MTTALSQLLHKLHTSDVLDAVAVISMDGMLIDAAVQPGHDARQLAAVACNGLLMARAMGGELGRSEPTQVVIEYQDGLLLMLPLGDDLGLIMLGPKEANLGRLRLIARKYAGEVAATVL